MLPFALLALFSIFSGVLGQDGSISGPTSSSAAAGYSCDATKCKLPSCHCASTDPPGGLDPKEVPMFVVFTADDAVQSYTINAINQFLGHRKNPNGCQPKMTYYTSLNYTNYTLVTDWYVAGNEIADHTMTHVGSPSSGEINGNLIALNALAGIPMSSLKGFRAPYLQYTKETLELLAAAEFLYDSSAAASIPVTDPDTDAFWPYTLDNGMANNCLAVNGTCKGEPKLPGFWEVPMYAFFDQRGVAGPHLMDPWLDAANGAATVNDTATLQYMQSTFNDHYNNKRQPIGLYTHPIHLATNYPGVTPLTSTINMINQFLDWAQTQQDVWIVSTEQLLSWVQNPVPASQLNSLKDFQCSTPQIDPSTPICNGIPQNEAGLLSHCPFPDFPFFTCYGCPEIAPTVDDPNPAQQVADGQQPRYRVPANCSTPFWDPIKGDCLCTSSQCAFQDTTKPIGPNGANLTGGGTGTTSNSQASQSSNPYVPFNGPSSGALTIKPATIAMALFGGLLGVAA
ncbi:hypothetical protein BC835DRAFT_1223104, partial [Cytidiella melzeri]